MAGVSSKSGTTRRYALIAIAVVFVVIVIAGFAIHVPVTTANASTFVVTSTNYSTSLIPVVLVQTSTVTYATTSTTTVAVTTQQSTTSQVWNIGQATLSCNSGYNDNVAQPASLSVGMDVQVAWSASDTVDVYVLSSTQFSSYSGTTATSFIAGGSEAASGSLSFHVSGSDTYYLVIYNPHNGLLCLGNEKVGLYSATGQATYQASSSVNIAQVVTYTTSSQTLVSQTSTSTSTSTEYIPETSTTTTTLSCSYEFWHWLTGSNSCPSS